MSESSNFIDLEDLEAVANGLLLALRALPGLAQLVPADGAHHVARVEALARDAFWKVVRDGALESQEVRTLCAALLRLDAAAKPSMPEAGELRHVFGALGMAYKVLDLAAPEWIPFTPKDNASFAWERARELAADRWILPSAVTALGPVSQAELLSIASSSLPSLREMVVMVKVGAPPEPVVPPTRPRGR